MSSYTIYKHNILDIKGNVDEVVICMANKDLLKRKMGIGKDLNEKDLDFFLYIYEFLNERFCSTCIENECFLNKINSLYYKYK